MAEKATNGLAKRKSKEKEGGKEMIILFGIILLVIGILVYSFFRKDGDDFSAFMWLLMTSLACGIIIGLEISSIDPTARDYLRGKVDVTYKYELRDSLFVVTDTIIKFK